MFVLTTLVYPVVLAALCIGAGLLVDRCSGGWLPGLLLPSVGAAALIGLSQLTTYVAPIARATPYAMAAAALAGFALAWPRARVLAGRLRESPWQPVAPVLAYLLALAPVLLAGRPSFSSYLTLSDSAVHMTGADYLLHHGQSYAHLDLRNSYGQYINDYYNTSYPSGSDTLFGGSAFLLGLPLIWAFQPFNAFMLALAAGPAWLLVRRIGLNGPWAALAALTATVPALVYGYVLIGSIKEITSLGMILTLGSLVVMYPRWLRGRARGAIPFALTAAAGVSALGAGFGAWVLAAAAILAAVMAADAAAGLRRGAADLHAAWGSLRLIGVGVMVALVAALPTLTELSQSLQVAQNIAGTGNPGNLRAPLETLQVVGVWLWDTYKHPPMGVDLAITDALIAVTLAAAVLGALRLIRRRDYPLAGWLALTLVVWLALSEYSTTWVDAKTLMLTTPLLVILAWGGVAELLSSPLRHAAPVLALALAAGVLASDALQYHSANIAPTARYQELASIDHRFAGRGPTLFADFDEYALYELRDLDVGGPNFMYSPPALTGPGANYRYPVEFDRLPAAALLAYPLIITRRDPAADRPPSAYHLLWQGTYYEVWARQRDAPAAVADVAMAGSTGEQCTRIGRLAGIASVGGERLVAATSPEVVTIALARASRPAGWARLRDGFAMNTRGRLTAEFTVPFSGIWNVWLQGQIMPTITLGVDGHPLASIGAQLGGNSVVRNTTSRVPVRLSAGRHRLSVARGGFSLAPGNGGSADLYGAFLTPAAAPAEQPLFAVAPARWRSLCGRSYEWVEIIPA
jgi:hypothetical protein